MLQCTIPCGLNGLAVDACLMVGDCYAAKNVAVKAGGNRDGKGSIDGMSGLRADVVVIFMDN